MNISSGTVSVIIVNWNSGEHLANCLKHLARQTMQPEHIWLVDNASTDSSMRGIEDNKNLSILAMETNLGFAEGNNQALEKCTSEYVALLNPDAFPEPDWLEKLVLTAESHPDTVAFGSRQLCADTPEILDGVGDVYHISGLIWREGYGKKDSTTYLQAHEIFSPCAAAALYRREALIDVGGLEQDFFCYVEDVDIGFRLRLAGHKALYVPDAVVHHIGSATTGGSDSDFSIYHGHRNLVWTYIRNMPGILFWLMLPVHIMLNIVTIIWFSIKGKGNIILRAKWDAIKGIPREWAKRKQIQQKRVTSISNIWQALDKTVWIKMKRSR